MLEFSNAIKSALYERAKKPFTGTFALAWVIINWKIWFTLLFVDEMRLGGLTKTEFIKSNYINYLDNLWIPIASAAALIFIIPTLNLGALFIKKWFDEIEFKRILKKTPADGEQVAKLMEIQRNQTENFTNQTKVLNETNSSLSINNLSLQKEIESLEKDIVRINEKSQAFETIATKYKSDLPKKEEEYKDVVKMVNDYRSIMHKLNNEFGNTSDLELRRVIKQLDSKKLRGSTRLKDIT